MMLARRSLILRQPQVLCSSRRMPQGCARSALSSGHCRLLSTPPPKEPGRIQQLLQMVREHGPVFVVWYSASYTVCWGSVWGVIEFAKVDGVDLLKRIGVERVFDVSGWKPWVVNAFLAMTITDCFEFIRLPLIVATTPRISRMVRQWRGKK